MAIVAAVCDSYLKELYEGTHVATDNYYIALYLDTANLGSTTTSYSITDETSGTGYTAGGQLLVGFNTLIDSGVSILDFSTDAVWSVSTITAAGALIYNSTKSNKAVAVLDFAGNVSSVDGDFIVEFPLPTSTAGLIRIS
jgi:hypothetical protein